MRRLILSFVLFIGLFIGNSQAQLEVIFTANPVVPPGGQVAVDVSVNNFDNLISCQWSINWDSLVLNYNSITNVTGILQNFSVGNIGTPDQGGIINPGQATVSWSLPSTNPRTIPDGTVLFTMVFDGIGAPCTNTSLQVTTMPLNIEAILDDGNFTDIGVVGGSGILEIDCNGNMPCGPNTGNPACNTGVQGGTILYGADVIAANGDNVCIEITTDNFQIVQSAQFTLNWDPNILTYTGDQNICPSMADYFASQPNNSSYVFVWTPTNGTDVVSKADGETIIEICFDVIGSNNAFADISFTGAEVADDNGITYDLFNDCGSVLICEPMPPGFTLKANEVTGTVGDEVCVDISACGFDNIVSWQFTMEWDDAIAQYNNPNIQNINAGLGVPPLFNFFAPDNLRSTWNSTGAMPLQIPDNEILFSVCFDLLGDCSMPMTSAFNFIDVPTVDIEIVDGNDNPISYMLDSGSITMSCPTGCTITDVNVTNPDCAGGTGAVEILGTTAWASCVWTFNSQPWINSNADPCAISAGLAGTYAVTITDVNGATCDTSFDITDPPPVEFIGTSTNIGCNGAGEIVISNITGGMPPHTICWSDPGIHPNPRPIPTPGMYTVVVKDANDCPSASMTFNIADTTGPLTCDETVEHVSCNGPGKVTLDVSGGCPTYTFSSTAGVWVGNMLTELPVGNVDITVTDINNDTVTKTVTINNTIGTLMVDESLTAIVHESCDGAADGSVCLTVVEGCGPFTVTPAGATITGNEICWNGLEDGSYSVTITDAQGTVVNAGPYVVNPGILITVVDTTITNATNGMNDGIVCFDIIGGTGYTITADPVAGVQNGNCVEGLPPGDYDFTIVDNATGCSWTTTSAGGMPITVSEIPDGPPVVSITIDSETGFNGFGVSCTGECDGQISWTIVPDNNISSVTLVDADGIIVDPLALCAGEYTLTVIYGNNMSLVSMVTISEPTPIVVSVMDVNCSDPEEETGAIDMNVTGGTGNYSFIWSNTDESMNLENVGAGTYTLMTIDSNDCEGEVQTVVVTECPTKTCYTFNNIITPGVLDNVNDVLCIGCVTNPNRQNRLVVYDRWGRDVFSMDNYNNTWGGTDRNGIELGEGTYFWVLDVTFENGETRLYKGYVTLLRDSE